VQYGTLFKTCCQSTKTPPVEALSPILWKLATQAYLTILNNLAQDNYLAEALKMRNLVSEFTPGGYGGLPPPDDSVDVRLSIDPTAAARPTAPVVSNVHLTRFGCVTSA